MKPTIQPAQAPTDDTILPVQMENPEEQIPAGPDVEPSIPKETPTPSEPKESTPEVPPEVPPEEPQAPATEPQGTYTSPEPTLPTAGFDRQNISDSIADDLQGPLGDRYNDEIRRVFDDTMDFTAVRSGLEDKLRKACAGSSKEEILAKTKKFVDDPVYDVSASRENLIEEYIVVFTLAEGRKRRKTDNNDNGMPPAGKKRVAYIISLDEVETIAGVSVADILASLNKESIASIPMPPILLSQKPPPAPPRPDIKESEEIPGAAVKEIASYAFREDTNERASIYFKNQDKVVPESVHESSLPKSSSYQIPKNIFNQRPLYGFSNL